MKQIKVLSLLTLAVLTSCQNETTEPSYNDRFPVVKIKATAGEQLTRSNPTGNATTQKQFNPGDQIAISADTQSTVVYTFGNDAWNPETNKNLNWESDRMTFTAYSPATNGTTMKDFTLPADQSSAAKIATADYMTFRGSKDKPADDQTVSIALERRMTRVIIEIDKLSPAYPEDKSYITNVAIRSGAASYADSAASGDVTPVIPLGQGLNAANQGILHSTYTALVIPTEAKSDETFITLTDGMGKALSVKGIPALEAGKSYTYQLSVGQKEIEITNVTLKNWNSDTIKDKNTEAQRLILTVDPDMVLTNQQINAYVHNGELTLGGAWTQEQFKVVVSFCSAYLLTKLDFSQTTGLTEVIEKQFDGSPLVTIKLPTTVKKIKMDAFYKCSKLTTIEGMENVVELENHPFYRSGVMAVNCPKATRLGDDLFFECPNVREIRFTSESFTWVYSHYTNATHFHPFRSLPNKYNITLYLHANQAANIVKEEDGTFWKPFRTTSSATGYMFPIPVNGFKAIYCGDRKVYPN